MAFNVSGIASVYRPPAVRDIQPANIPAVSPAAIPPLAHPMGLDLLYDRFGRVFHSYDVGRVVSTEA